MARPGLPVPIALDAGTGGIGIPTSRSLAACRTDQDLHLAEILPVDISKVVHDQLVSLLSASRNQYRPHDSPYETSENRENGMERVVDWLALDQNGLEVRLRLDPEATRRRLLKLLGK